MCLLCRVLTATVQQRQDCFLYGWPNGCAGCDNLKVADVRQHRVLHIITVTAGGCDIRRIMVDLHRLIQGADDQMLWHAKGQMGDR